MNYVGERPWWPIQRPNKGRKKEVKGRQEREIRSRLSILDLKAGKLCDLGKEEEGKMFHELHVLTMNDDLWDRVRGLVIETWKGCSSSSA